ncbi:hypothetical protein C7953_2968 [Halanaerobium congolense]|nr:hypothetical protein [Halanaerobium congolense]PTX14900.1 hypothetical protein C7953_2968 [Halanaerobium congolense]
MADAETMKKLRKREEKVINALAAAKRLKIKKKIFVPSAENI